MKNLLLLVLLCASVFVSCKKSQVASAVPDSAKNSIDNAVVTSMGKLVFSDTENEGGVAKIYLRNDGAYVLGLEQMDYKSNFDMNVYLSSTAELTTASIKLFSAKNFNGNSYYALPAGISIQSLKHLIIQNDTQANPAASAALQ